MHQYKDVGLDYVWLSNGYRVEEFGAYGFGVAVMKSRELETVLALGIAFAEDAPMEGQEFRFLRIMMDLGLAALAASMQEALPGASRETILDAEESAPAPSAAARIRALYLAYAPEGRAACPKASWLRGDGGRVVFALDDDGRWTCCS